MSKVILPQANAQILKATSKEALDESQAKIDKAENRRQKLSSKTSSKLSTNKVKRNQGKNQRKSRARMLDKVSVLEKQEETKSETNTAHKRKRTKRSTKPEKHDTDSDIFISPTKEPKKRISKAKRKTGDYIQIETRDRNRVTTKYKQQHLTIKKGRPFVY